MSDKDTISRTDAIELVKDVCDAVMSGCESWHDPDTEDEVYKDIREVDAILKCNKEIRIALRNLPSAQPEVIRCKDCKYMTEHYDTDGNVPYWTCSEWDSGTDYDGFCHYAERRTDDEQRSS